MVPMKPCTAPQPSHGGCPEGPGPLSCCMQQAVKGIGLEDAFSIGLTQGKLVSSSVSHRTKMANAWLRGGAVVHPGA